MFKKSDFHVVTTAAVMAMGILGAPSAQAAVDMFIKIGDIEGESQAKEHKNDIDILAWSWAMSENDNSPSRRGRKICIDDLSFTKFIDKASAKLALKTLSGELIPEARLVVRETSDGSNGAAPLEYLSILMHNVVITGYQTGGANSDDRLTEEVTLNFEEMEWTYTQRDSAGGIAAVITDVVDTSKSKCR